MTTPTPNGNPNANVAGSSGVVAIGIVWFLGNVWPHAQISAELGAGIAGGTATVLLWLGRNGLAGVKNAVLHGWRK